MPLSSTVNYVPDIQVSTLAGSSTSGHVDGTGTSARFYSPTGSCVDYSGTYLYLVEQNTFPPRRIVIASGVVTSILTADTWESFIFGIACDDSGGLYFAGYTTVRFASSVQINANSPSTVIAGTGAYGSADSANGSSASFAYPRYLSLDFNYTSLYVADFENCLVRKMSTMAPYPVSTIAYLFSVVSVVTDETYLYAVAGGNYVIYRELLSSCTNSSFVISTVYAGRLGYRGHFDGSLLEASFYYTSSLSIDSESNLYVVEYNALRFVSASTSSVSTLAGLDTTSGYRDGNGSYALFTTYIGFAAVSSWSNPSTIFVSDMSNNRVRLLTCAAGLQLVFGACGRCLTFLVTFIFICAIRIDHTES